MSETIEQAQEGIEKAHEAAEHGGAEGGGSRKTAVLIAILAASLALAEMGEKGSQNLYLTHHISVSDTYAFMQSKTNRRTAYETAAEVIESMPGLDAAGRDRVTKLRAEAARMDSDPIKGEGAKQLAAKAAEETELREHEFHTYHKFERATGALQIAIVLASVSIVTRVRVLTAAAAVLGGGAAMYALLVWTGTL